MEIHFYIGEDSFNSLSWEEVETFERMTEGNVKLRGIRPILAKFMVDEKNNLIPREEAMKILGKLSVSKIRETIEAFTEALKTATLPKANGSPLKSPSEVQQVDSPSQPG